MLYDEIVENPQSDVDRQVYSEDRRREPVREVYSEDRRREPVREVYIEDRRREPVREVYIEDRRREPVREVYSEDRVLEPRVEVMYAQPRIRDGSGRDTRTARKISKPPGDIPEKIRKASRAQY